MMLPSWVFHLTVKTLRSELSTMYLQHFTHRTYQNNTNKMRIITCNSIITAKDTRSSNCDQMSTSDCEIPIASDSSGKISKTKSVMISFEYALPCNNLINSKRIKCDLTI